MKYTVLLILYALPALAGTLYVPGEFPSIQAAIDAASNGDTVLVGPGTYVENIDFLGKAIAVKSASGPFFTTIDGGAPDVPQEGSVVRFWNSEGTDSLLEGFRITNGLGYQEGSDRHGGGIYCGDFCSPTLTKNIIIGNSVLAPGQQALGGGIFCGYRSSPKITNSIIAENRVEGSFDLGGGICCLEISSPLIQGNLITHNEAHEDGSHGGAIYLRGGATPEIMDNTITGNTARIGSAIYCVDDCVPVITDNTISGHVAYTVDYGTIQCAAGSTPVISENALVGNHSTAVRVSDSVGGVIQGNSISTNKGCGIFCQWTLGLTISGNVIAGNKATGIKCYNASPIIWNNTISGNSCETDGGGILIEFNSDPEVIGNIIADNTSKGSGGGIMCSSFSNPLLLNNTITGNYARYGGGGITFGYKSYKQTIANSILWNNSAEFGYEIYLGAMAQVDLAIRYSILEGGVDSIFMEWGNSAYLAPTVLDADPLLVDPEQRDYHLTFDSPCRGTGNNHEAGIPATDFEGDPRVFQGFVDMGADEFHPHLYFTGNAIPGKQVRMKIVGRPGADPVGLFIGSGVLDPPMATQYGNWYLEFPIIGPILLIPIPSSGVADLPVLLPGTMPGPYAVPSQAYLDGLLTNLYVLEVE